MKEISIFYGEGSEAKADLPTGLSFLKESIFTKIDGELKNKLSSFYSNNQYNKYIANTMYSSSKDIYKNVAKKTVNSLKKEIDDD